MTAAELPIVLDREKIAAGRADLIAGGLVSAIRAFGQLHGALGFPQ